MNWPPEVEIPFFKNNPSLNLKFLLSTFREGLRGYYSCSECIRLKPAGEEFTTGTAPTNSTEVPEHLVRQMEKHTQEHIPA